MCPGRNHRQSRRGPQFKSGFPGACDSRQLENRNERTKQRGQRLHSRRSYIIIIIIIIIICWRFVFTVFVDNLPHRAWLRTVFRARRCSETLLKSDGQCLSAGADVRRPRLPFNWAKRMSARVDDEEKSRHFVASNSAVVRSSTRAFATPWQTSRSRFHVGGRVSSMSRLPSSTRDFVSHRP